ncbi:hypothetical protein CP533_0465 [Ophiocordyceps camponoti-saundersi (nom. inval.)]|nr:hypothetical protein CP533_0465 [Ophiocordyceps camponoti-saundersi (nom. inval.)]
MPHRVSESPDRESTTLASPPSKMTQESIVAQALALAREETEGATDDSVFEILEAALSQTWAKVLSRPHDYVMTRGEFSVFNYFQHRFVGQRLAIEARRRYWDNAHA